MATAVVLAFTVMGGDKASGGEVFLQATSAAGPDPFTPSTATRAEESEATPVVAGEPKSGRNGVRTLEVNGAQPGLYGGTRNVASCDVERQVQFLTQHTDKRKAFAEPLGIRQSDVPSYLRSLTPVRLGWDTRVTNHGYRNGATTRYQAVLQAGTPVLVDDRGVPRVRCACGNPLAPPVAVKGKQTYSGRQWSSFRSTDIVAVRPAEKPVKTVTMFDPDRKGWYERPSGDVQGMHDHETAGPKGQRPESPHPLLPAPHREPVEKSPDAHREKDPGNEPDRGHSPAKDPGKDQENRPGKEAGQRPAPEPGKDSGNRPDEEHPSGRNPGYQPDKGESPAKEPTKDRGDRPGTDPGQSPAPEPGKAPGNEPGKNQGPDQEPNKDQRGRPRRPDNDKGLSPAPEPGKAPGYQPDKSQRPDNNRGSDPVQGGDNSQSPGKNQGPGKNESPGKEPDKAPGNQPDKDPGQKTGGQPGHEEPSG
ncbi:DUF6777 domain-containing protein [Streptomyces sp. NPDC054838]